MDSRQLFVKAENECFFAVVAGNRSMRELKVALYHYIDGHLPRVKHTLCGEKKLQESTV